ncbi:prepilin-type N-terminal cleavage/methylation domain-containing protein [Orenia metallireducens]|jgi:prepilin-type N-terminal cleavage/methylation domain-containing protein|uniref:Prepilin-type N-terminal cleavage/methylation domain-containing protein n=1 Tax=Orenia metallireducens TaxID=1413210 RepID=A0A285F4E1_9FIRM|nr:prepilin-type N-terminal cleavage/methylation domain-containing protein [Orenia metallireducens]PRX34779.1 prepilin-type N-terminal cleavage/methylation domain-containing protein [Orenia metallireducens]SNY05594.1 prepilin-type N-terminal cleavage/methylation domain-containing protein [Orenia metallireducens]
MSGKEEGFSLVEILIVITVMAVILSLLYNLQLVGSNLWRRDTDRLELQLDSLLFLKQINQDLRATGELSLVADNSTLTLQLDNEELIYYFFDKSAIYRNGEKVIGFVESSPFQLENSGLLTIDLMLKKNTETYRVVDKISTKDNF